MTAAAAPILEFHDVTVAYGRRPVLLLSVFGLAVDYLLTGFAPNMTWLFIGRIFAGICGASYTTANAYLADITRPELPLVSLASKMQEAGSVTMSVDTIGSSVYTRIPFSGPSAAAFTTALISSFVAAVFNSTVRSVAEPVGTGTRIA